MTTPPPGTRHASAGAQPTLQGKPVECRVSELGCVLLVILPITGCDTPAVPVCTPSGTTETAPVGRSSPRDGWPNEPAGFTVLSDGPLNALVGKTWRMLERRTTNGSGVGLTSDTTTPTAHSAVLQFTYAPGFPGGYEPGVVFYNPGMPVQETYFGFRWKPSNPWEPHPSGVNKIAFMFPATSAAGTIYLMMFYDRTNYTIQVEPTFASDTRRLAPNVTATPVALGRWHLIEWTVRYSTTPTSRDGATKWWLDGVLQGVYTDLQMPPDPGIIEYQFAPTWGGLGDSKAETGCYWYESAHISRR